MALASWARPLALLALALAAPCGAEDGGGGGGADGSTIELNFGDDGAVRVQLLSKYLARVEKKGPAGFEDRPTFNVVNRDWGERIGWQAKEVPNPVTESFKIQTDFYTVIVNPGFLENGMPNFAVFNGDGDQVYDSNEAGGNANLLHFPHCYSAKAYGLVDAPRFYVPEWGPTPMPDGESDTNGYDFGNDVWGDTYVFVLGSTREDWLGARVSFVKSFGEVPLLPDYAFGTWFTWWFPYDEAKAKEEIKRWDDDKMPIDVWGLDMEWRFTENDQDREYDHPNTTAFPDFGEWFEYINARKLRTYFNDHPFPKSQAEGELQTSATEINFRWGGLTKWMDQGLDFWWYDPNWKFSIPPPMTQSADKRSSWNGLQNIVWGSHVYYALTEHYDAYVRPNKRNSRSLALSQCCHEDVETGQDPGIHAEVPAHHRYPVWWTGDFVELQASVETMVNQGLYDFRPYTHSDCGGDGWFTAGDLMRWTAHCAFGNIFRYHGGPHQVWIYGDWWEHLIRQYLELRYKLMPTVIAYGQRATQTGFPLVARADFYWPENVEAQDATQYIWCDDFLVAPIWDSAENTTTRSVWIPPGEWQDVWNGEIVEGPIGVSSTQPYERQPMWHRVDGGLVIMSPESALRVEDLDWSTLVLEGWASKNALKTDRAVYEKDSSDKTDISMESDGSGKVTFMIGAGAARDWVIRLHLRQGEMVSSVTIDGASAKVEHIPANDGDDGTPYYSFFPFKGVGEWPASKSGSVAELKVSAGGSQKKVVFVVGKGTPDSGAAAVASVTSDDAGDDTGGDTGDDSGEDGDAVSQPFDCDAGYSNWEAGWSAAKKEYCCRNAQKACSSEEVSEPFDCDAGYANWRAGWSDSKRAWCCTHQQKGCLTEGAAAGGGATGSTAAPAGAAVVTDSAADPAEPAATGGLPDGWVEKSDPDTGKKYYWNSATGTSQWSLPKLYKVERLSGVVNRRLPSTAVMAGCTALGGLLVLGVLAFAVARAVRLRPPYDLVAEPPQSPQAPLIHEA